MIDMDSIIKSHRQIQYYNLIEWAALKTNTHLGAHPFDASKDLSGDFIYNSNKNIKRYSPLYPALTDEKYIHLNCSMEMGYTNLFIYKKLILFRGDRLMVDTKYENASAMEDPRKAKYFVFQDPFTKLFEHGPHDVLFSCEDVQPAREYAVNFTKKNGISTLVAEIKFSIYWH